MKQISEPQVGYFLSESRQVFLNMLRATMMSHQRAQLKRARHSTLELRVYMELPGCAFCVAVSCR